jgi:hypothetical protein
MDVLPLTELITIIFPSSKHLFAIYDLLKYDNADLEKSTFIENSSQIAIDLIIASVGFLEEVECMAT